MVVIGSVDRCGEVTARRPAITTEDPTAMPRVSRQQQVFVRRTMMTAKKQVRTFPPEMHDSSL